MPNQNTHVQDHLRCKKPAFRRLLFISKITAAALIFLLSGIQTAMCKEYKVSRASGEHIIVMQLDRYPLVLGDNAIKIEIRDKSGKIVKDANVLVNYYMPPMPRMVPMNYKVEAEFDKEAYTADMDIIMAGPWYIKVIYRYHGKIATAKFNVDAQ